MVLPYAILGITMGNRIGISLLNIQAFCEYQIYLERVRNIPNPAPNRATLKEGQIIHESLLQEHERLATPTDKGIPNLAEDAKETGGTTILREVYVVSDRMEGRIDEVRLAPKCACVIDDKPKPPHENDPYISSIRQIQGYGVAFTQYFKLPCPTILVLRDRSTGKSFWHKTLTSQDFREVNEALDRIEGIMNRSRIAQPTKSPNKCRSCSWHPYCDKARC